MSIFNPILRGLQFLWALLVLSIIGNMVAETGNVDVVNYSLFCAVFAMLSLLYLIPVSIKDSFAIHPMFPLALDVLNTLFWFCGAVAMAAELTATSCSNDHHVNHNKITRGSHSRCREAQASTAFLWFGFAAFAASTVMSGLSSGGSGGVGVGRGGIRRGPAMSQV